MLPLPPQPADTPWPTQDWPPGPAPSLVVDLIDEAFTRPQALGVAYAVVVVQHGRLLAERYGGELHRFDRDPEPVTPDTPLLSWSMAKSMLHAAVGVLVGDGLLAVDEPADVPLWREAPDDLRAAITLDHLLSMRDGLDFVEDYVNYRASDVIDMLFGAGQSDMARFAADRPLLATPGERFNYSSGTSNIVSGIVARRVGRGEKYEEFLRDRLFGAIGMRSARPGLDKAGTWVASSYVHATARDFARFGLLYLRDGVWEGRRLLPEGWVDHGRQERSQDPEDGRLYGAHWWVEGDEWGSFRAAGYEGQSIVVSPGLDAVVVRLGKSPVEFDEAQHDWRTRLLTALAETA